MPVSRFARTVPIGHRPIDRRHTPRFLVTGNLFAAPFAVAMILMLGLSGCTIFSGGGPGNLRDITGGTRYGLASCRVSERGACPELSGRTLYTGSGTALFFSPDGYLYSWADRDLVRRFWGVDASGNAVSFTGGDLADFAFPIAELQSYQAFEGDAAQLRRRYGGGARAMPFALTPQSPANFRRVLDRLYA